MSVLAAVNPNVTAGLIGLVSAFIGGSIAAWVSFRIARETRDAAEREWIRDSRRAIYNRFLDSAQTFLNACERYRSREQPNDGESVTKARAEFFQAYGTVQTVAHLPVIEAVRAHAYRLWELEEEVLRRRPVLSPDHAEAVERSVRHARHRTIDAMRIDLGVEGSAEPPDMFNPFDDVRQSGSRDDHVKALKDAYDNEIEAAREDKYKVRPGWEGSPHAEVAAERPTGGKRS